MKILRSFFVFLLVMLAAQAQAQKWSYIYIQGDKEVPFYVKLEGEMLPRHGKNYCIIPQLSAGPVHIQILFQQNLFPPQNYTIMVPDDGFRAFLLSKRDNNYTLYDIHQQFYLHPGEQDNLPPQEQPPVSKETKNTPSVVNTTPKPQPPATTPNTDPQFLDNVVLNDTAQKSGSSVIVLREEEKNDTLTAPSNSDTPVVTEEELVLESDAAPIPNSDCPAPMSSSEYDRIYQLAKESGKGDKLITYLLKKIEGNCYTTRQVFQLADLMEEEALIYLYLKRIFPRITDQHNFHLLEQYLFESEEWITAFRLIH